MTIIKKLAYVLVACLSLVATVGCSDPDSEITTLELSRALRPTDVEVKVLNKVDVRIKSYYVTAPEKITYQFFTADPDDETVFNVLDRVVEINCAEAGKTHQTLTHNIKSLKSETAYMVVISSVLKGRTSGIVEEFFETDPEQILNDVTDDDLTSSSIKVTWEEGLEVTRVEVVKSDEVLQSIDLTPDNIAAGECVINDLKPESKYTIYIYNGNTQRGKIVATTLPEFIPVYAGRNVDIQSVIDEAEEGETIMLLPAQDGSTSSFDYQSSEGAASTKELVISKNITISCLDTKPVTAHVKFYLAGCNGVTIKNIKFAGTSSDAVLKIKNASGKINIEGVEVTGYKNFISNNKEEDCTISEINVRNCFFHDMCSGARFIDLQSTRTIGFETFNFVQNTVANCCSGSDFIRIDYTADKMGYTINFENNTIYKVEATSKGLMYIRSNAQGDKAFTCNVKNNVFAECSDKVYYSQDKKTDGIDYFTNYYFNAPSLLVPFIEGNSTFDPAGKTGVDPKFKDPANNDFTITNEDIADSFGNTEFKVR